MNINDRSVDFTVIFGQDTQGALTQLGLTVAPEEA